MLSGGSGKRLGGEIPKQYIPIKDRMIIEYVLDTLCNVKNLYGVAVVAAEEWKETVKEAVMPYSGEKKIQFVFATPGENRQLSIYNGLLALKELGASEEDIVLIQDAARPNTAPGTIEDCFLKCEREGFDGAVPVLPMKDTVYLSNDGKRISSLIDRRTLFAGQAPEAFCYGAYLRANEALLSPASGEMSARILSINGSSEPAFLFGMNVAMIPGDEGNYKITTIADLERFRTENE